MNYRLPTLPWGHTDLEPFLSSETIDSHYFGHHKAYIDKTNELMAELGLNGISLEKIIQNHEGKLFEQAAQAWNHTFYWMGLRPAIQAPAKNSAFFAAVEKSFGSIEKMKERFMEQGQAVFGSGWTWLVIDAADKLDFLNTQNADNPIRMDNVRPLWVCDVWEHAYYIDYRNVRKEYLEGAWSHVNWDFVENGFNHQRVPNMSRFMCTEGDESVAPTARM